MTTLVIPPHQGKAVSLGGLGVVFKISGESSEGRFSTVEHPLDPGRIVHPHVHAHEDEFSYILEGDLGIARLADKFADGDPQATKLLFGLLLELERRSPPEPAERPPIEEADRIVIESLLARLRAVTGIASPGNGPQGLPRAPTRGPAVRGSQ